MHRLPLLFLLCAVACRTVPVPDGVGFRVESWPSHVPPPLPPGRNRAAKTVVYVHGNPGFAAEADRVFAILRSEGWKCTTFDRPGHGERHREPAAFADQLRALHAAVVSSGDPAPILIAHSWGAGLAYRYAQQNPVCALVLLGPEILPDLWNYDPAAAAYLNPFFYWTFGVFPGSLLAGFSVQEKLEGALAYDGDDLEVANYLAQATKRFSRRAEIRATASDENNLFRELQEHLTSVLAEPLPCPVVILAGTRDTVCYAQRQAGAFQQKHEDARVYLVAGGHMLSITHPAEVAAAVQFAHQLAGASPPRTTAAPGLPAATLRTSRDWAELAANMPTPTERTLGVQVAYASLLDGALDDDTPFPLVGLSLNSRISPSLSLRTGLEHWTSEPEVRLGNRIGDLELTRWNVPLTLCYNLSSPIGVALGEVNLWAGVGGSLFYANEKPGTPAGSLPPGDDGFGIGVHLETGFEWPAGPVLVTGSVRWEPWAGVLDGLPLTEEIGDGRGEWFVGLGVALPF